MQPSEDPGHERTDANLRGVALTAVGLAAITTVAMVVVFFQMQLLGGRAARRDPAPPPLAAERPAEPPAPRLQTTPAGDLARMRGAEQEVLGTYGWVDRPTGVVRVPLARARELVLRESDR